MTAPSYEPLSARDAWFLYAERPETPLDIGTVYVFEAGSRIPGGPGAAGVQQVVAERLHLVPRYRQRLRHYPLHLSHPVWVDDVDFDLGFHIRREALPTPGDGAALRATVARILARPLDLRRPLWDLTVVTGLADGRVVLVNRAHHAMVDGVSSADIATLLLDLEPAGRVVTPEPAAWTPRPLPTRWELLRPLVVDTGQSRGRGPLFPGLRSARRVPWRTVVGLGLASVRPRRGLFFNRRLGMQRTGRGLRVPLSTFRGMKATLGSTVNDGVLAVVAEAMHRWLAQHGDQRANSVRVFCPVSIRAESERSAMGNRISGMVFDLPVGPMDFSERVRAITAITGDLKGTRQAVAADALAGLADWAPPTLLFLAGRVMSNQQAGANLNVTNVPGPQFPLYCGGARLLEVWPFAPLYPGMGLGIAAVSYDGGLYFGLTADPVLVPDIEVFRAELKAAAEAAGSAGPVSVDG
ncbi:MAG: wax ester/triacylglycerol synthase family O-acyltransferase [Candidatus Dormibacteria bacterium]